MHQTDEWHNLIERYRNEMMATYSMVSEPPVSAAKDIVSQEPANTDHPLIDIGTLQVRVSTENEAVPIPGAVITVTESQNNQNKLIRTMIADENGLTPLIELPTKDRRLSLSPGNEHPYAVYTVDVTANGYFSKRFMDLPIYGGVTAIQNVSMIPLPEYGDNDVVLQYAQNGPTL